VELLTNGTGLTAVVFLPLISALILTAIPKSQELLIKGFALVSSIVTFILSALLLPQFDFSNADKLQLGNKISWIKSINANYEIGIDGISLPLLIPVTFILGYFASIFRHIRGPLFAEGLPTWNILRASFKRAMLLEPPNSTSFFLGISESVNVNVMYDLFNKYTDYLYGATFLKPFVFYIPRSIWANKPQSITVLAADFLGGSSLVTTIIGEVYMNFYLLGMIILPFLLWYTDVILTKALNGYGAISNIVMFFFGILIFRMPFSDEFLVFVFLVLILKIFNYVKNQKFVYR